VSASERRALVVGAGLAGIAAARRLQELGWAVTVLEQGDRVGGRVRAERLGEVAVDLGASFLTTLHTETLRMVRAAGLESDLLPVPMRAALLRSGRLRPLGFRELLAPPGLPARQRLTGLLRLAVPVLLRWRQLDPVAAGTAAALDTGTAAAALAGRADAATASYLVEPVLAGFLYSRSDSTSTGMLQLLVRAGLTLPRLYTLRNGLASLAAAAAADLDVVLHADVRRIARTDSGWDVDLDVLGAARRLHGDGVVVATTADVTARLVVDLPEQLRQALRETRYVSTTVVAVGLPRRLPDRYAALLLPPRESPDLALAAVLAARTPGVVPPERDVLVLYGSGSEGSTSPEGLLEGLAAVPAPYHAGSDEPLLVARWPQALPHFRPGQLRRVAAMTAAQEQLDGLVLAGDYLAGPLIEGAVRSGRTAAKSLTRRTGS
jgi:protoporphyrinogen/coproporphyrinogen III oxidase